MFWVTNKLILCTFESMEVVVQSCSVKKAFSEVSQNSQENTCPRVSFNKVAGSWPGALLKKRLWYRCFIVSFEAILRTPFFIEYLWWLLLNQAS